MKNINQDGTKRKNNKREEAFRILEILKDEKIDLSGLLARKRIEVNGRIRYLDILLFEIKDNRIHEIIEKHGGII